MTKCVTELNEFGIFLQYHILTWIEYHLDVHVSTEHSHCYKVHLLFIIFNLNCCDGTVQCWQWALEQSRRLSRSYSHVRIALGSLVPLITAFDASAMVRILGSVTLSSPVFTSNTVCYSPPPRFLKFCEDLFNTSCEMFNSAEFRVLQTVFCPFNPKTLSKIVIFSLT